MCVDTVFIFSCDHRATNRETCNKPKQNKICRLIRLFFRNTHKTSVNYIEIDDLCNICKDSERFAEQRQRKTEEIADFEAYRQQYEQRLQTQKQGSEMQARARFFCSVCLAERRHELPMDAETRAANSGLCCARGIDEHEAKYAYPSKRECADLVYQASRPEDLLAEREMTYVEQARREATVARAKYRWRTAERDSAALDPELISEFIKAPGNNPYSLPPEENTPQGPLPGPLQPRKRLRRVKANDFRTPPVQQKSSKQHVHPTLRKPLSLKTEPEPEPEPQSPIDPTFIDWTRWNSAPQTPHGRLPPPPSSPLPQPVPVRKQFLLSHRPSYDGDGYPPLSPVSLLNENRFENSPSGTTLPSQHSSSWLSPWSSTTSLRTPETVATKLEGPLNRELNRWTSVGRKVQRRPLPE